jgi:ATP-dependent Clp protease ATP-binding subunit ClpA
VLEFSLRESLSLGHRNITPGHILLGLTRDPDGNAMQVLVSLGADKTAIGDALMPMLPASGEAGSQIPRASRPRPRILSADPVVRRLLAAAGDRALTHGQTEFGLGDFLASVTDDDDAATVLASLGVDIEAMREAIERDDNPPGSRLVDARRPDGPEGVSGASRKRTVGTLTA